MSTSKHKKKLRYFKCPDYRMIPSELIKQIDGQDWTPENFVKYQEALKDNENNILFVLVDVEKSPEVVVGFLWGYGDDLKQSIIIHGLSVMKEYQDGELIPFTKKFMEFLIRKTNGIIKNIYWYTDRKKAYEKYGFHKSKYDLMCLYKD